MTPVLLTLPIPPTVNNAFKNRKGGRAKTQATKDWEAYAGRELRNQQPPKLKDPAGYIVIVNLDRGERDGHLLREDADNRVKLLFDLLVREDVLEDDSQIAAFAVAWAPPHSRVCRLAIMPCAQMSIEFHPAKNIAASGGWTLSAALFEQEAA